MSRFKKKLFKMLMLVSIFLILVAGIVVAVVAQNNIIATSNISVQYDSTINANVLANYWVQDSTEKTNFVESQQLSVLTEGDIGSVSLSKTNTYIVFEYIFTNNLETLDIYAHLTYEDNVSNTDKNMILEYYISDTQLSITQFNNLNNNYYNLETSPIQNLIINNVLIKAQATKYVYVRAKIEKTTRDAEFSGTCKWAMQYDPYPTDTAYFTFHEDTFVYNGGAGDVLEIPAYYTPVTNTSNMNCSATNVDDGRVAITSIYGYYEENGGSINGRLSKLIIPETITYIGGYSIYGIGADIVYKGTISQWLQVTNNESLEGHTLDLWIDGVKCNDMTELVLPEGLTSINSYALFNFTSLETLTIPSSVASVGEYPFGSYGYQTKLKTVIFAENSQLTSISDSMFSGCSSLENITIPSRISSIGNNAFYGCSSLKEITLSENITSIGERAFSGCSGLTQVNYNVRNLSTDNGVPYGIFYNIGTLGTGVTFNIGENVETLPDYMFVSSSYSSATISAKIAKIVYPQNTACTSIDDTFAGLTSIKEINIPSQITTIETGALTKSTGLEKVEYAGTIEQWCLMTINDNANVPACVYVEGVKLNSLTNLSIPEGITEIKKNVFNGLSNLKILTIPSTITKFGATAFANCTGLTTINFNVKKLTTNLTSASKIFQNAGANGTGLTCNFGELVESVPPYLFYQSSTKLTGVTFDANAKPTQILGNAFNGCANLTSFTIPKSVSNIGASAFNNCTALTRIDYEGSLTDWVGVSNNCYASLNSKLYIDGTKMSDLTEITIPEGVTSIALGSFASLTNLVTINLPSSLETIGNNVFRGCTALTDITLPDELTTLGTYVFYGCTSLASITIPSKVTSIGSSAFYNCTALTNVTIPSNVTSIGSNAFYNCTALVEVNYNVEKISSTISSTVFRNAGSAGTGIVFNIGESVKEIPANLFYYSTAAQKPNVVQVVLPAGSSWSWTTTKGATTGTPLTETEMDPATLATNMKGDWRTYYLIRTDV